MEGEPPGWEGDEGAAEENADPAMDEDLDKISLRVEESADLISGLLDRLERELAGEAMAVWGAYIQFCEEEMGLGAEKVLKATFKPALQNMRFLEELAAGSVCSRNRQPSRNTEQLWRRGGGASLIGFGGLAPKLLLIDQF